MLAAYSVARVVPPLARVLRPALVPTLGFSSTATVGTARPPSRHSSANRSSQPRRERSQDGGRATAPAGQTTSRRLAAVPRAPRVPPPPASKTTLSRTAAAAAAAASPLNNLRTHENMSLAQPRPFTAFEMHPGLQTALAERFPRGQTTPIQSLSLAKLLSSEGTEGAPRKLRAVLGAETGSGKTLAYLVPLLHHLKATDKGLPAPAAPSGDEKPEKAVVKPRALVLAPTHELTRQSTRVAKDLSHGAKLRVQGGSSRGLVFGHADVLFTTGRGAAGLLGLPFEERERPGRPLRPTPVPEKKERTFEQRIDLSATEWLVIDEADVLLGPDFVAETTRVIERVRAASPGLNVLLVTATLPPSLLRVLEGKLFGSTKFEHLLSPGLHRLPRQLDTRFVPWSGGGNRVADVVHEIKRGFAEDAHEAKLAGSGGKPRAVVFCGSVGQVKAISTSLQDKDVPALSWTGESKERVPGHNGPLDAFLATGAGKGDADAKVDTKVPRVLVTTSLLSRGLDFSADVTAIYLVDPPRDVLDFVHRAGRAGRAGRHGRVVVFGVNGANELRYGKEIKSVLGKVERRAAVKPGGRTWSGKAGHGGRGGERGRK